MSLTITVPADVPSLFHNSKPVVASFALRNTVLPTASGLVRGELEVSTSIVLTSCVSAAVPSLGRAAFARTHEQDAVQIDEVRWKARVSAWGDVLDRHGPRGRAVALPQLQPGGCVGSGE